MQKFNSTFKKFEMAAMPFPCNGILLIQGNLPRVFPAMISLLVSIETLFKEKYLIEYEMIEN